MAQTPAAEPAYVVRGHQVEARQREFRDRLTRFHEALTESLRRDAPDLLANLEPPPAVKTGYQLLPRIVPDASKPPAKPQVISYSWSWSEKLMADETATLEKLEADLSKATARPAYEPIVTGYTTIVAHKRLIDSDVDYNWLWQAAIAKDRPGFDAMTRRLDEVVERQKRSEPITQDASGPAHEIAVPSFVGFDRSVPHRIVLTVPFYTDIEDIAFVDAFQSAIETIWHVRAGEDEWQMRLRMTRLTPSQLYCGQSTRDRSASCTPPAPGEKIDLAAHAARFPKDGAALTTGAASLQIKSGPVLVVAPHDVTPRALAHELGHMLGFPDFYLRGYRDAGADGFRVLELVPDALDIMASPGTGLVLLRHFNALIAAGHR
jgi:hypothetical protein